MKNLFVHRKQFKGKVLVEELKRAHYIIALLAFSLAFVLIVISLYPVQPDVILAAVASALLIILAAISISIALFLSRKK